MAPFWYIIANPAAGNGKVARNWPNIERQLQEQGISYTVQFTRERGHAVRLVEDAILKGHRFFLGIGGDGTNHEMVNGILSQTHTPPASIYYALLPMGTGNDWARTYQITGDPQRRIKSLKSPQIALQDAGKVCYISPDGLPATRYFVNVAGMAYDGYVAKRLDATAKTDNKLAYLIAVGKFLFEYTPDRGKIEFEEGQSVIDDFYTVNVGICRYSGGGMQFVPHAIPDDGLLALTFARKMPRLEVLLQTPRFYNGTLLNHSKVTGVQTKQIKVTPLSIEQPIWLETDGEFIGHCPAEFTILEKVISVVL